jgi:hypothetical protein
MKKAVFWDMAPCAHAGSSLADFLFSSTLKMEAIRSYETSVNTISTRHHIPRLSSRRIFVSRCVRCFSERAEVVGFPFLVFLLSSLRSV